MDTANKSYKRKIERETEWYKPKPQEGRGPLHKVLHHPLIYSPERISFNYIFPKEQMASLIRRNYEWKTDMALVAPCGKGDDFTYLDDIFACILGVDVSLEALSSCPKQMPTTAGDILNLPFPNGIFDIVVCSLFFHHYHKFGFLKFLEEFRRVLKPGGVIVILEPSFWYPLNIITRPIKLLGNPFDEVLDEGPFRPSLMVQSLNEAGFINNEMQTATFSHPAIYIPLARVINRISDTFLRLWPFKIFGWLIIYTGQRS